MPNYKGHEASLKKYQPKWKSGATQTIRVPVALADQILDYAHHLDEGEVDSNQVNTPAPNHLLQVIQWLEDVKNTPRNNFTRQKKELVQKVIDELKTTVTSD